MLYLAGLVIIIAIFLLLAIIRGKPGVFHVNLSSLNLSDKQKIVSQWSKVKELVILGKPSHLKEAILTADNLVDFSLKKIYPLIEKSIERYKKAQELFENKKDYDDLWYAHKVRNEIVHNIDFDLPHVQALDVLGRFEKSLEILVKGLKLS